MDRVPARGMAGAKVLCKSKFSEFQENVAGRTIGGARESKSEETGSYYQLL